MMINYRGKDIVLIGEVKPSSPSGFMSPYSWRKLFDLANESPCVDMISIHTDPRWEGSFESLKEARALTEKPILAKGYHATDRELRDAFNYGADRVLVVGRIPNISLADFCYYEPLNLEQLHAFPVLAGSHRINTVVWNARDISNPEIERYKTESINEARKLWPKQLVQASAIRSLADIAPEADQILVGSYLPQFLRSLEEKINPLQTCRVEDSNL